MGLELSSGLQHHPLNDDRVQLFLHVAPRAIITPHIISHFSETCGLLLF
jgi:hypothetical protein